MFNGIIEGSRESVNTILSIKSLKIFFYRLFYRDIIVSLYSSKNFDFTVFSFLIFLCSYYEQSVLNH